MCQGAELVEESLRDPLVVDEGVLVCVLCFLASRCSLGGGRGAGLDEGGRNVGRRVEEGSAGVADVNANEVNASPISSEGAK